MQNANFWFTAVGHELYPFLLIPNLWRTSLLQFPWCTTLLCPWSVKSCTFLISVWHCEAHWQFIRFSQNVHRKSDLLHQKQWGKISHCHAKMIQSYCLINALWLLQSYETLVSLFFITSQLYPFSVFVYKRRKRRLAINPFWFFRINKLPKPFEP